MNDLLVGAKGSDITVISTPKLASKMKSMGYSVSPESILLLLNNNPFVASADESRVTLSGGEGDMDDSSLAVADPDNNPVSTMAQAAVQKQP